MKILQKICFVLLLSTFSSAYAGSCFTEPYDVDDCRVRAEQGYAKAQSNLGVMYNKGLGVPQNYKEAVKWYTKAAEQGLALAQFNLGFMYAKGQGVLQDYKKAVKWYTKSAEQGDATAQYNLGVMYDSGQDVIQDYKEAVKWYIKAAEQGFSKAQYMLGHTYHMEGRGVIQDNVMAHMYFNIASVSGDKDERTDAIGMRDVVEVWMTPSQIEKAQGLALEWMSKH